jgi:mRNA-degrading endonuclease RelE of RelBE toxin-antitoxin system
MKYQPEYSPRFKRAFKKLSAKDQKDVKSAIAAMLDDPNQPFLRTERVLFISVMLAIMILL